MSISKKLKTVVKMILPHKPINVVVTISGPNRLLENQVILVTGGASGIGKSTCKAILDQGAKAIAVGRRINKLQELCDELGDNCRYMQCDITQIHDFQVFFDDAGKVFESKITGFVNNAGVYMHSSMMEFTQEDYDKTLDINLKYPVFLIRQYIAYCKACNIEGNVVVNASNRGLFGDVVPYGMSKRAIESYVEGMARELIGTGIRINAVAPGMTASEINNIDVKGDMYTSAAKGKRVIHPDEIGEVITFLLSNNSKCITGAIIPCDDGDRLR